VASDGSPHSLDLFKFAIELNVIGTFNLTRRVLEHLIKVEPEGADGERGVVIMVSSAAAVSRNHPDASMSDRYHSSKVSKAKSHTQPQRVPSDP
jgi:NAD(P)-dependent dehydrogenase (short-subunit alcohol dehydrogenase family)